MLSTYSDLVTQDHMSKYRVIVDTYEVRTVSLDDLFGEYSAPRKISYLSIDTEGSEYAILSTLNFKKYVFNFITVEHNFTGNENMIESFLARNGYIRILKGFTLFDGWYINAELQNSFNSF